MPAPIPNSAVKPLFCLLKFKAVLFLVVELFSAACFARACMYKEVLVIYSKKGVTMMLSRSVLMALAGVCLWSAVVFAAVGAGDKIPHSLEALDQNGAVQNFDSVKGENGAVVHFIRSADWCPYCKAQLLDIKNYGPQIKAAGYSVVVISYDAPETLADFAAKYDFPYVMLSDEGSKIIKAFGILNEKINVESPYYGIPHPTIYVITAAGEITAKLAEDTPEKRPTADLVLEAIR